MKRIRIVKTVTLTGPEDSVFKAAAALTDAIKDNKEVEVIIATTGIPQLVGNSSNKT